MRHVLRRASVIAGAVAVMAGSAAGVASAAQTPSPGWYDNGTAMTSYSFGTVNGTAGQTASQTFVLENSGGSATAALTISLTGSPAFTETGTCQGSLGPGKSCAVTVTYAPTADPETDQATLTATGQKGDSAFLVLSGASAEPAQITGLYFAFYYAAEPVYDEAAFQSYGVTGTGFLPNSLITFTVTGAGVLGNGLNIPTSTGVYTDDTGAFSTTSLFPAKENPQLNVSCGAGSVTITATDGTNTATATLSYPNNC
jgi:hypothetical protein